MEYVNQIIEDEITQYNDNYENNTKNNITLDDIIMQEDHAPIIDSFEKEENNIDKIMDNFAEENKKKEKMEKT